MAQIEPHDDEALENQEGSEDTANDEEVGEEGQEERPKLNLEVKIDSRSACERHITVSVAREDIDRYLNKEFSKMMPERTSPVSGRATRRGSSSSIVFARTWLPASRASC